MTDRYSSFLIRYWRLRSAQRRVEVERIQSGERRCFATLDEALAWIESLGDVPAVRQATAASGGETAVS